MGGGRSALGRWGWVPVAACACYEAAVLASVLTPGFRDWAPLPRPWQRRHRRGAWPAWRCAARARRRLP